MSNEYTVETNIYNGPLAKLLDLIKKRKRSIHDVELVAIAEEFLSYVKEQKVFPAEVASQFIDTATSLLVLKAHALLPEASVADTEEGGDIEMKLRRYQKLLDTTQIISQRETGCTIHILSKNFDKDFIPPTTTLLSAATQKLIDGIHDRKVNLPRAVVTSTISLQSVMSEILKRVQKRIEFVFKKGGGHETVVGLLAILELYKGQKIDVTQSAPFHDILVSSREVETPNYS
jgi:segregation and condensation protein A